MGNCGVLRYETYSIFLYAIVGKERQICNCLRYAIAVQFREIVCFHLLSFTEGGPCLEVSTMKLSDEFNLLADESPCFSGLFFFEII